MGDHPLLPRPPDGAATIHAALHAAAQDTIPQDPIPQDAAPQDTAPRNAEPQPTVVLVEGISDRAALEVLASRRGPDLTAHHVEIVAIDGATNIARHLEHYGPHGLGHRVAGLYDVGEERFFRAGLERAGLGAEPGALTREAMAERGFFVCDTDLEDELIRAVGAEHVVALIEQEGGIRSFHTLQRQPALRERSLHDQLRRLMSGRSGGKLKYARLMAEAVPLARIPAPLAALLDHVSRASQVSHVSRASHVSPASHVSYVSN